MSTPLSDNRFAQRGPHVTGSLVSKHLAGTRLDAVEHLPDDILRPRLGAVGGGAHAPSEWVRISSMQERSDFLHAFIKDLLS